MDDAFLREPFRHGRLLPLDAPGIFSVEDSVNHLLRNAFRLRLLAVVRSERHGECQAFKWFYIVTRCLCSAPKAYGQPLFVIEHQSTKKPIHLGAVLSGSSLIYSATHGLGGA